MENRKTLNEKLDLILKNQKTILGNEKKILGEEKKLEEIEKEGFQSEEESLKTEEDALKELMVLEKQIKKGFFNPLNKITKRDLFKGFVGAFIGILGHFAFMEAFHFSQDLTFYRATVFFVIAFLMIVIMLYYTGFKKIKKHVVMKFLPLRAVILYIVSIVAVLIINFIFGNIDFPIHLGEVYKLVAASIMLAVIGAGTADLIGENE